jgi:hypothetical protein
MLFATSSPQPNSVKMLAPQMVFLLISLQLFFLLLPGWQNREQQKQYCYAERLSNNVVA